MWIILVLCSPRAEHQDHFSMDVYQAIWQCRAHYMKMSRMKVLGL